MLKHASHKRPIGSDVLGAYSKAGDEYPETLNATLNVVSTQGVSEEEQQQKREGRDMIKDGKLSEIIFCETVPL